MEPPSVVEQLGAWFALEVAFRAGWLVGAVILAGVGTVIGTLLFGRNYKKRITSLERQIRETPPVVVNVGKDQEFDPEAVARELDKIYTRRQAEAIVRLYAPRKDDEGS